MGRRYFTKYITLPDSRISTVYDMIHEGFSNYFPDRDITSQLNRIAVDRADHIICIPQSTKRDLCESFGVPQVKISVIHLGLTRFSWGKCAEETLKVYEGF